MNSKTFNLFRACLPVSFALILLVPILAHSVDFDLAETSGSMRLWHTADGLPADSITAILQSKDGFLWIGTSAGLVRFDGVKFTPVSFNRETTNSPVRITALCEDSDGHLWIGTHGDGLFQLADGQLMHYGKPAGLLDEGVTSLAAGKSAQVWIGCRSGLCLWDGTAFKAYTVKDGLPDEAVSGVNVARSGTVWITTRTGMCRIIDGRIAPFAFQAESQGRSPEYLGTYEDRRGNLWAFGDTYLINLAEGKRFNYFRSSESASVRIWSLCEGKDGRVWIGTSGRGLFCFEDNHFKPVIMGENRWPHDVRAICEDNEGNLWLGTSGGGLVQLRQQSAHVLKAVQDLPGSLPTSLAFDAGGRIYVGMERGGIFVGDSGRFESLGGGTGGEVEGFVTSVSAGNDGGVWAGTLGSGLYGFRSGKRVHITTANGLADDDVVATCVDGKGNLCVVTLSGTLRRFAGKSSSRYEAGKELPVAPITALAPAAAGGLWLGTKDGQILREENGRFKRYEVLKSSSQSPVLAIYEADAERLWFGTAGAGLGCLNNGRMFHWGTADGLPDATVAGIVEDKLKNLWLVTGAGIHRINRSDLLKAFADPLAPISCKLVFEAKTANDYATAFGGNRAVCSSGGELWLATADGLLNVDSRQNEKAFGKLTVEIENASFNGQAPRFLLRGSMWPQPETGDKPFRAPVDVRSLEFHFTALSFGAPGEVQFRHKLEGFDPDWVEDSNARSIRYGRIPYGSYVFRVAANRGDGDWQESVQKFAFIVPTPFYRQTWAIGLFVIAAISLVVAIVRIVSHRRLRYALVRMEQQQSLERERMRIARDLHDDMGSKLTKISFLSEHAQVDEGAKGALGEKIQSIADTSRQLLQTMDEIVWVVNPHNDSLENLAAYLSHYAEEYFQNTSVECELRLPKEIPYHPLASDIRHNLFLAFEETLNNVLKHSKATGVKVEMSLIETGFEIKVSDNGVGFEVPVLNAAPPASYRKAGEDGLQNMRHRLADVGGEFIVESQPGAGTTIIMKVRINFKPAKKK